MDKHTTEPAPDHTDNREALQFWGQLFTPEREASDLLKRLLVSIAQYISINFMPTGQEDLTPKQLAIFYRAVGGNYDVLFLDTPHASIGFIYRAIGCLHSLRPTSSSDGFSAPTVPCLTKNGFKTWEVVQLLLNPEEHVPFLQAAVKQFDIIDPATGAPFPNSLPKQAFPEKPDELMVQWYESVSETLSREAQLRPQDREDKPKQHTKTRDFDPLSGEASSSSDSEDEKAQAARYFSNPLYRDRTSQPKYARSPAQFLQDRGRAVASTVRHLVNPKYRDNEALRQKDHSFRHARRRSATSEGGGQFERTRSRHRRRDRYDNSSISVGSRSDSEFLPGGLEYEKRLRRYSWRRSRSRSLDCARPSSATSARKSRDNSRGSGNIHRRRSASDLDFISRYSSAPQRPDVRSYTPSTSAPFAVHVGKLQSSPDDIYPREPAKYQRYRTRRERTLRPRPHRYVDPVKIGDNIHPSHTAPPAPAAQQPVAPAQQPATSASTLPETMTSIPLGRNRTLFHTVLELLSSLGVVEKGVAPGHHRIRWTNMYGKHLFDDYVEHEQGALQLLETYLRSSAYRSRAAANDGGHTATHATPTDASSNVQKNTKSAGSSALTGGGLTAQLHGIGINIAPKDIELGNHPSQTLHLLCCVEIGRHAIELYQELVTHVTNDQQLFHVLRDKYFAHKGRLKSYWSLRTVNSIHFMKFAYSGRRYIDPRCHYDICEVGRPCRCIPPDDLVLPKGTEYKCHPVPAKLSPPIGPRLMMDFFTHPDDIDKDSSRVLEQLPKWALGQIRSEQFELQEAWGIYYKEDWDWIRIWWILAVGFFPPSLLFGVLWGIMKRDLQGAFGVASWWMTGATIFLGVIGTCTWT